MRNRVDFSQQNRFLKIFVCSYFLGTIFDLIYLSNELYNTEVNIFN